MLTARLHGSFAWSQYMGCHELLSGLHSYIRLIDYVAVFTRGQPQRASYLWSVMLVLQGQHKLNTEPKPQWYSKLDTESILRRVLKKAFPLSSNKDHSTHSLQTHDIEEMCWEVNSTWRMASSGMLRRMVLVRTDVSEERSATIIRVTRIGELVTTLAVTSNRRSVASYG
jgi:hypothetical protein